MSGELGIRALSLTTAAKLLKLSPKHLRAHIRRGFPVKDGRIDLVVYPAWLNQHLQQQVCRENLGENSSDFA